MLPDLASLQVRFAFAWPLFVQVAQLPGSPQNPLLAIM